MERKSEQMDRKTYRERWCACNRREAMTMSNNNEMSNSQPVCCYA